MTNKDSYLEAVRKADKAKQKLLVQIAQHRYSGLLYDTIQGQPELICYYKFEGTFFILNDRWEDVLGWEVTEMEGRSIFDFIHPDDHDVTRETLGLNIDERTPPFYNRYITKDGGFKWIYWHGQRISHDPDKEIGVAFAHEVKDPPPNIRAGYIS